MKVALLASLLGAVAFVLQVAASQEAVKLSVSVWPPGSNVHLGECVLLRCTLESNSSFVWSYRWFRLKLQPAAPPNPRHLVSGDSYSITAVTREDAGSYRCQAERREGNATSEVLSPPAALRVSELPPPELTLTPSTRLLFGGERFTVRCPAAHASSSGWVLRRFPPGRGGVRNTDRCSPLGGAVSADSPAVCVFTAASGTGGLYWCEAAGGRSGAVSVSASDAPIILKTPASSVLEGGKAVLYCQYRTANHSEATFFKNGAEIATYTSSSPDGVIVMTIDNVTREDEGVYRCASPRGGLESPESWLSVRPEPGNLPSAGGTAAPTGGSWRWIVVSCGLLLLVLVPPAVCCLLRRYRYQTFCTRSCWPVSKEDLPAAELPATKQDATEVQWDLSWMEMSNLLDKQLYPGT